MLGLMQDSPLLISGLLSHAAAAHGIKRGRTGRDIDSGTVNDDADRCLLRHISIARLHRRLRQIRQRR